MTPEADASSWGTGRVSRDMRLLRAQNWRYCHQYHAIVGREPPPLSAPQDRALEGHFACGSGLLIESDFLGRSCATKTASRDATISLPNVPADWQRDGFLDSPAWSSESHRDPNQEAKPDWDVTSGITNNDDGAQPPESARVRRWQ